LLLCDMRWTLIAKAIRQI